jgi:hypothetical protein
MRRLFLIGLIAFGFVFTTTAQEGFKGGVNIGIPVGDFSDYYSFNISVDVSHIWEVSDQFDAGATAGYSHGFGDSGFDDAQFLPLAGVGRFKASDEFSIGIDLGYAIGINDGNDGGFYYRPIAAYSVSDGLDITASYAGVSLDGASWATINVGAVFRL